MLWKNYFCMRYCYIFASRMYSLWKNLPSNIQNQQPFFTLCYADDPLSWGDEKEIAWNKFWAITFSGIDIIMLGLVIYDCSAKNI